MIKLALIFACDLFLFLNFSMASYNWINDHDNIMSWLYQLLCAIFFAILSVRYDKDE